MATASPVRGRTPLYTTKTTRAEEIRLLEPPWLPCRDPYMGTYEGSSTRSLRGSLTASLAAEDTSKSYDDYCNNLKHCSDLWYSRSLDQ